MNKVDISLYGIVDPNRSKGRSLAELAKISAENGATLIQYRDKQNDICTMIENAKTIKKALRETSVPFIVNDRVDIALASDADGVHLGQEDMRAEDARQLLGDKAIIGLSIKTIAQAENAPIEFLDYAFVGGVFDTQSKDNKTSVGIDGWVEIANILKTRAPKMPVGAIAGIDEHNIGSLFEAGCDGVAMISALYMADDVAMATKKLANIIHEVRP
jgi:thiamine-phosphate pyrophosphorylase